MFISESGQNVAKIGNIKIGGEQSEFPFVLIGSMFYQGHKIVKDERTGDFDKEKAKEQIRDFLEFSKATGIPIILDVVGAYKEPLLKFCEFVANQTDIPFLVDGLSDDARIYAIEKLIDMGYRDRAVYNSIDSGTTLESCEKIRSIGVKNAVLLCFGSRAVTPQQKIQLLISTDPENPGLLEKVRLAGIQDYIVDVAVLDIPSIAISAGSIKKIKEELKIPVGCAPVNALAEWENWRMFGKVGKIGTTAAVISYLMVSGADFGMYGSINKANDVFPGIALLDSVNAYYRKRILKQQTEVTSFFQKLR
jgi:tetrahydromethanopterin S-methyltransferase subunit H